MELGAQSAREVSHFYLLRGSGKVTVCSLSRQQGCQYKSLGIQLAWSMMATAGSKLMICVRWLVLAPVRFAKQTPTLVIFGTKDRWPGRKPSKSRTDCPGYHHLRDILDPVLLLGGIGRHWQAIGVSWMTYATYLSSLQLEAGALTFCFRSPATNDLSPERSSGAWANCKADTSTHSPSSRRRQGVGQRVVVRAVLSRGPIPASTHCGGSATRSTAPAALPSHQLFPPAGNQGQRLGHVCCLLVPVVGTTPF